MASAQIGALNVSLGLNSAQFTSGLTKASKGLNKFGVQLTLGLETVANQLGRVVGAIPRAIKASIDHADALSKSAQKAGTTVEALSRLEYAAKLSDVSLESLTGGLQKLSKSMVEAAQNSNSSPAKAFAALGVAVKDSAGNLRDTDVVFAELAEKLSRVEDGALKTAIAQRVFGKSGAELIPLLNEGAAGLKKWADESDRTGNTITTKTAKAAEKFNDTLTRLSEILRGVINQMMEAVLPSLQALADAFMNVDPHIVAVGAAISGIAVAVAVAAPAIGVLTAAMKGLYGTLALIAALPAGVVALATGFYLGSTTAVGSGEDALVRELGLTKLPSGTQDNSIDFNSMFSPVANNSTFGSTKDMWSSLKKPDMSEFLTDLQATSAAQKSLNADLDVMNNTLAIQREEWEKIQEPIKAAGDALASVLGNLVSDIFDGRDAISGLMDSLKSLGEQLIQMALNQLISNFIGSLFGGFGGGFGVGKGLTGAATYGVSGNGVYGVPGFESFDGGGFTGGGSRSGGMDGKGGFMAMLHPNETVIDHTKGGGGGQSVVRVELGPGLVGSILKQAGEQSVQIVRSQAPAAVATAQRNKTI